MTDRNRSNLDREQDRPENRSTKPNETDRMGGNVDRDKSDGRDQLGSEHKGGGNRSTGNIEGDENLNRR